MRFLPLPGFLPSRYPGIRAGGHQQLPCYRFNGTPSGWTRIGSPEGAPDV